MNKPNKLSTTVRLTWHLFVTHLEAEKQEIPLTPSDLGKQIGVSGKKFNKILSEAGLQEGIRSSKNKLIWMPTEKGQKYCTIKDTGKKHRDGVPVVQVFWFTSVIDLVNRKAL